MRKVITFGKNDLTPEDHLLYMVKALESLDHPYADLITEQLDSDEPSVVLYLAPDEVPELVSILRLDGGVLATEVANLIERQIQPEYPDGTVATVCAEGRAGWPVFAKMYRGRWCHADHTAITFGSGVRIHVLDVIRGVVTERPGCSTIDAQRDALDEGRS